MRNVFRICTILMVLSGGLFATDSMLNYAKPMGDTQNKMRADGSQYYYYTIKCNSGKTGRVWVGNKSSRDMYVTNMQNQVKTHIEKDSNYDFRDKLPRVVKVYCQ